VRDIVARLSQNGWLPIVCIAAGTNCLPSTHGFLEQLQITSDASAIAARMLSNVDFQLHIASTVIMHKLSVEVSFVVGRSVLLVFARLGCLFGAIDIARNRAGLDPQPGILRLRMPRRQDRCPARPSRAGRIFCLAAASTPAVAELRLRKCTGYVRCPAMSKKSITAQAIMPRYPDTKRISQDHKKLLDSFAAAPSQSSTRH